MKGLGNRIFYFLFPKGNRMRRNIFLSISSMVVFVTTYMLILPAITQSTTTYCGLEEHTHTSACYETTKELICGEEESEGHTHTDDCYTSEEVLTCENTDPDHVHDDSCYTEEKVLTCDKEECEGHQHTDACYEETTELVCGMEEHEHDASCYADPDADVEESADWEATLKDLTLIGKWSDDLVTVAKSQLGYKESEANYSVDESGEKKGYTRYGAWYGNAYDDWSAMFASFCLNYAGVDTQYFPEESSCSSWIKKLNTKEYPYYYAVNGQTSVNDPADYAAAVGDLAFLDCDSDGAADHVGILEEIICNDDGSVSQLTMILGDSNDCVESSTCDFNDGQILGFAKLPENPAYVDADADTESQTAETVSETEETSESEETASEKTFTYESEEIAVTAEVSADAGIPADAEFKVIPVTRETEGYNYDAYMQALNEQAAKEAETVSDEEGETTAEDNGLAAENAESLPATYTEENTLLYDIAFLGSAESYDGESSQVEYQPKAGSVKLTVTFKQNQLEEIAPEGEKVVMTHLPLSEEVKAAYDTTEAATDITAEDIQPETIDASIKTNPDGDDVAEFSMENFSIVATAGLATQASGTNKTNAVDWEWQLSYISGRTVYLNADITTNATINITGNTTIDLNGHKIITTSSPLFNVTGGSLTIVDSATPTYTTEGVETLTKDSSDDNYGKKATYSNGTLTYYVTMPDTDGCETGVTKDTLVKYTVTNAGMIVGNTTQTDKDCQAIVVSGGTLNLNGGYICNFTSESGGAAVNASGGTVNVNGSVLAGNTTSAAKGGGAISVTNATLKIDKGVITGNSNTTTGNESGGGGVFAGGSSAVTINGGYITNNSLAGTTWNSRGGGIMLDETSSLTMNDGYITGNEADQGGGGIGTMYNKATPTVTINGGYICSNYAKNHEGGGVALMAGTLTISGDNKTYITNNRTDSSSDWGGGGVFVAENAYGYIYKALIISNTAGGFGGGIAGCSTGHIYTSMEGSDGAAVFDNSADGEHLSGDDSSKSEDHVYANGNATFMSSGYQDAFCQHNSVISGGMLSGTATAGTEKWTGSIDGAKVSSTSSTDLLTASNTMGLTANPSDSDKTNAKNAATVYITGNDAYTHGGGVLSNGFTFFGTPHDVTFPTAMQVSGRKYYYDENHTVLALADKQFTFYVYDENEELIATGSNDEKGRITFDNSLNFTAAGTYTYTIREANNPDSDNDGIIRDTTIYKLTITATTVKNTSLSTNNVKVSEVKVSNVVIQKKNGDSGSYTDVISSSDIINNNHIVDISDIFTADFTNYKANKVTINVTKKWSTSSHPDSVTVHLLRNGEAVLDSGTIKGTVTLSNANNWKYTWTELLSMGTDSSGKSISYTYTVKEDAVDGYSAGIEYDNTATGNTRNYWVRVTGNEEISPGTKYVLVSNDNTRVITTQNWPSNQDNMTPGNSLVAIYSQHHTDKKTDRNVTSSDWYQEDAFNDYNIFTGYEYGDYVTLLNSKKRQYFSGYWVYSWKYMQNTSTNSNSFVARVHDGYLQFGLTHLYDKPGDDQEFGYLTTQSDNGDNWTLSTTQNASTNFKVYKLVTAYDEVKLTQDIIITNTETDKLLYKLDITKESSETDAKGNTIVLPNAKFEVLDVSNGNAKMYFTLADGYYTYASSNTKGATTTLITDASGEILIKDIPHGTYVLHESEAPEGYYTAADRTIELDPGNASITNKKLDVTIVDASRNGSYELPKTGGTGTTLYTMSGCILCLSALGIGFFRWRRRERRLMV